MTGVLGILLAVSVAGLALLAHYVIQLHIRATRLTVDLETQRAQLEHDINERSVQYEKVKAKYAQLIDKYNDRKERWKRYCSALKTENQRLCKWRGIADADTKAAEMTRVAREALSKAQSQADHVIASAQERAASLLGEAETKAAAQLVSANEKATAVSSEAREKAKTLKDEARSILDSATRQCAKIIEAANKKAMEVAGSAYDAKNNAALYESTVRAMKNIIEGYGDEFIMPEQSLLDDLADDFYHTRAGQELRRARETTNVMIRNGTAATCEYVEVNRRETAIEFVVDAFNGKVDSILSRVKAENAGKLEQQIRDAFTLVNYNGKAFRDTRITEEYLAARLEELKWAAIVQQLVLQEREEQRRVKEQIRDEARAAKERERALRDLAKEEETLRRGLQQAQQEFDRASGEQKAMYEERLREMGERLKQAEERKDRVRSMAEQTTKGYVYVISNVGSFGDDVYKIGLTRRWDPYERVGELGDSSVPFEFDVHAMILSDDAPALERQLHEHFRVKQVNKVNHRKEFFRVSLREIRDEIENLGVTSGVHWTMSAEAKHFRESQAVEESINRSTTEREAWIKRQRKLESIATDFAEPSVTDDDED